MRIYLELVEKEFVHYTMRSEIRKPVVMKTGYGFVVPLPERKSFTRKEKVQ